MADIHLGLMQDKNEAYKRFKRSNKNSHYSENFQSLQNFLEVSIEGSKLRYYSRLSKKLMEPSTSPKTNFKEKAVLFNSFFAKQYSVIDNGSDIPYFLHPKTDKSLSYITFTEKNIEKVIQRFRFK